MTRYRRSDLSLFDHLRDREQLDRYDPFFQPWVATIRHTAQQLQGTPRVPQVLACLQRLENFMQETRRVERDFQVLDQDPRRRIAPDAVPLDLELKVLQWSLEAWHQGPRPEETDRVWEAIVRVLVRLPPWVVYAGPATPVWYRCLKALYRVHRAAGEQALRALFEMGKATSDPDLRLLARGALDFVRISLHKEPKR